MPGGIGYINQVSGEVPGLSTLMRQVSRYPEYSQLARQGLAAHRTAQQRALQLHEAWASDEQPPWRVPQPPGKGFDDSPVGATAGSIRGQTVRVGGPAHEGGWIKSGGVGAFA